MNDNPSRTLMSQEVPFSEEAEEAVIGAILINPDSYLSVASFLKPDDFYFLRHQYIWQALNRLSERDEPVDYLTLSQELRDMDWLDAIGGLPYLTHLINNTPTSIHAEFYGHIVERTAIRRRLLVAADEIKALAHNEQLGIEQVIVQAEQRMFNVTERQLKREFVPLHDAVSDYFDQIEQMMQNPQETPGTPSGFRDLDELLGGFQKSDLLIFAGRPGMGKCLTGDALINTRLGLVTLASLKPQNVAGVPDEEGGIYYPLEIEVQTPGGIRRTSHFYDSGVRPTLSVRASNGYSLSGTLVHPVLTVAPSSELCWKPLSQLQVGDHLVIVPEGIRVAAGYMSGYPAALNVVEVLSVEAGGLQHCYDLTVPDGHSFIANGIVCHNTSFMLTTAVNAARMGGRVAIFTMEMGSDQLVQRMISMETGINSHQLRMGRLSQQEYARFVEAAGRISKFQIFIDDTPALNPLQMRTKCRRLQHEYGLDLVMVDYLQLMNSGGTYENNRVQEVSFISRAMKELARELNVPIFSAAQLSRAVEQRQDKRPLLSDLRESGCLAGDTLIHLPDEGQYVPIRELSGKQGFRITSLNADTMKLESSVVSNAFCTGTKPVYRLTTALGRTIRATGNHQFLTIHGWKRLDELTLEDHIAVPRTIKPNCEQTMTNEELALLGHLIGDGCTLPKHSIQYTTREIDLAELVAALATEIFGDRIRPRIHQEKGYSWYQVFLPPTQHLTHRVHNPIRTWLEDLGVFGLRSYEKRIPSRVFQQPPQAVARFLRHLWATDGCITTKTVHVAKHYPNVYYASSSPDLAYGVQTLLLQTGINARVARISQGTKGRMQYHVTVTGQDDLKNFVDCIGAVGAYKTNGLAEVNRLLENTRANTNRDIIPHHIWKMHVVPAMESMNMTTREMYAGIATAYAGTSIYKQNISRDRANRIARVVQSEPLAKLAASEVYWDSVVSIEPDGETDVYDLTVPGNSNFVANNIIAHNSLEQDADIVMFLYRDVVYNDTTEFPNQAEVIIAKHRNGATGTVSLYFDNTLTKFMDGAVRRVDLGDF